MSPGRSNKPLFEVLSQNPPRGINPPRGLGPQPGNGAPSASGQSTRPESTPRGETSGSAGSTGTATGAGTGIGTGSVQAELKPRVTLIPSYRPAAGRPGGQVEEVVEELEEGGDAPPRPVVTIPLSTVYSAVALAGALILIAWIGGHTMGAASKQAELIGSAELRDVLSEPSDGAGNLFANTRSPNSGTAQGQTQNPQAVNPSGIIPVNPAIDPAIDPLLTPRMQASASGTILSAAGLLEIDPRESGLNYLELGTFSREMTQGAIGFLAANGVSSIGVPQPGGMYRLVSVGVGIPGGQWSAMASERTQHQRTVGEIGSRWVQELGGGSDFRQTQWTKYQP